MWASAPTHLAIEFHRGGALPRPLVDAHINPVWMGSTSAERIAVDRRRDSAKARRVFHNAWLALLKYSGFGCRQSAERIPKPLVLAAFFGYFLSLMTESTSRSAFVGTRDAVRPPSVSFADNSPYAGGGFGTRIATASVRTGFAMTAPKFCPVFCGIRAFFAERGCIFPRVCYTSICHTNMKKMIFVR